MRMDYLYVKGGAKARRQSGPWKKFQDNKKMPGAKPIAALRLAIIKPHCGKRAGALWHRMNFSFASGATPCPNCFPDF
jgi:hypothetical protein